MPDDRSSKITSLSQDHQPFLKPVGSLSAIASSSSLPGNLASLASKILQDPLLQIQLSDRVYQLLLEDLRQQKERNFNYRSRLND